MASGGKVALLQWFLYVPLSGSLLDLMDWLAGEKSSLVGPLSW